MKRVLLGAVLILALMIAIKDGRILRKAGLAGSCAAVATPTGESGAWQRCTPGKLQGAPSLSRQGCTSVRVVGNLEYWRCPARIDSSQGT